MEHKGWTGMRTMTAYFAMALVLAAPGVFAGASTVPPQLAGQPLAHAQQGAEARAEIERLHGKSMPMREGFVAHYGSASPAAMLYVSRAQTDTLAKQQVEQMTARIRASTGPFTHLREATRFGLIVYSALGQGQVHYYFRSGATVVWLAADALIAREALADAVSKLR